MIKNLTRRDTLALLAAGAALPASQAGAFVGSSFLEAAVDAGDLPPVNERVPANPRVVDLGGMGRTPGQHGGTLRVLIGRQKDIRIMPMFGYSRLVGYDPDLNFVPDVLASFEVEEGRIFTFTLREGHRWSDGAPFTTEDLRYAYEDVMKHDKLPGIPAYLKPEGHEPVLEVVDELTVRYVWPVPNPEFLPALAAPVPPRLVMPSHYMKQFHADHTAMEDIQPVIDAERKDDWRALHTHMSRQNRPENPDLPTLEPWRPRTKPPSQQFVFERNPYFHRVDENGLQLPYVDRFVLNIASFEVIAAKTATGDSDLQATSIGFGDFTVLKEAEGRFPVSVKLWKASQGSRIALYPNLNTQDEVWRNLFRDVRTRRAMSLAVDRSEINQALFFGLCNLSANTVLPQSPLFKQEYADAWASYDPDQANKLLDEAGFGAPGADGLRVLPDGRPANLVVESAGESTVETDVLELIRDQYRKVGIGLVTRTSQRDIFRSRILAGQVNISVWVGLDNGLASADMPPRQLAPTADDDLQWPVWGVHFLSGGSQGKAPDMPEAQELVDLFNAWRASTSSEEREEIWHKMLSIHADQVFTIGTVNGALQPLLHAADLQNVPDEKVFGYSPTSYLGIYMPDTFWREG